MTTEPESATVPVEHKVETIEYVVSRDGIKLAVRVHGSGQPGVPVLMFHGLQSHSGWFEHSQYALSKSKLPVYAMDRRGSGLSEGERGECRDFHEMARDAQDVASFIRKRHNAPKVHLFGHCFGTLPAVLLACTHPNEVASLTLASSAIYTVATLRLTEKVQVLFSKLTGRPVSVPVPLKPHLFSDLPEYVEFIKRDEMRLQYATGDFYFEVLRARRFIRRNMHRLKLPVLMMEAGGDQIIDNEANHRFFDSLPSDRKVFISYARARHVIEFSAEQDQFISDVLWWIRSCQERANALPTAV